MRWPTVALLLARDRGCTSAATSDGTTTTVATPAADDVGGVADHDRGPGEHVDRRASPGGDDLDGTTTSPTSTSSTTTVGLLDRGAVRRASPARSAPRSRDGRSRRSTAAAGPATPVVVIGVIHGDEDAGLAITDRLAAASIDVPDGIDLWIIPAMNPDGVANQDRHNADQVDLNRNFPLPVGPDRRARRPEYAGTGPASEPETQAIVDFLDEIRPEMVIWYHQDLDRIAPSTGRDGRIRARYAELTGVPLLRITGGTYTGVAATWARNTLPDSVAFIVELGPTLSDAQADTHAAAVLTVAGEL